MVISAKKVILAAGAFESIPAFPGWSLPGVMTTGAAQSLLRSYRISPGDRVLVAGNGPLNMQLACELLGGGVQVLAVAEASPQRFPRRLRHGLGLFGSAPGLAMRGLGYLSELRRRGVPVRYGYHIARAAGDEAVQRATLARLGEDGRLLPGSEEHYAVDALCLGYGLQPANELARLLGCRHVANAPGLMAPQRDEYCESTVPGVFVVGDGSVLGGAYVALAEGRIAARAITRVLRDGGPLDHAADRRMLQRQRRFQKNLWSMFRAPEYVPVEADALLCRCESVPLGTVTALIDEGVRDFGTIKRRSRVGMGSCQGRYCQRQLATVIADRTGDTPAAEALFEARLPVKPVPIALLAGEQPDWQGYRSIDGDFAPRHVRAQVLTRELDAEVLVIGAGIIGLSTALCLAEAGVDVAVVDSGTPFGEASASNAGSLHGQLLSSDFSDRDPSACPAGQALRLQRLGIGEWQTLEARLGVDFELELSGGLVVAATGGELHYLERKAAVERAHGLEVELLDRAALRDLLPAVSPAMLGAAYCRDEGKINPLLAAPALLAAASAAGVRLYSPCAVTGIVRERGVYTVRAGDARIRSPRVVNAAGGWAAGIAALLGETLPVHTAPQQMIVTEPMVKTVPMLVAAAQRHLTLKQLGNGNVLIGGGWPAGFDAQRGRAVNLRESIEGNLWIAQQVIPDLAGMRMLRCWATVGVMIDGAPILGEHPGLAGFFNAVGANGYTMGPIMGRITAGLIRGEEPPLDLRPFLLERFQ